jgi:hypothetical protein
MPKGKPWKAEEEAKLREYVQAGYSLDAIASRLGKTREAVRKKAERLGLEVVGHKAYRTTTSEIRLPAELPSVEETLKILAGALTAASKPGLDKVEVQRLQVIATLARTYEQLLARYIDYRGIEQKLVELEAKYAQLAEKAKAEKAKSNASG